MLALVAIALLTSPLLPAQSRAAASNALDAYLNGLKTLRAEFAQTVTDSKGNRVQSSKGAFVVQRPGKFRWQITPEGASTPQLMVADGKNLWFYDQDLEQVTVKPAVEALTATPASLLSGDGNVAEYFRILPDGKRDGVDWVKVTPTRSDADFREVRIGFQGFGSELKRMVLKDKLGQTVNIEFTKSERNAKVDAGEVSFEPPAGADVIGTPAK
jgi:outer membrane lipoprotein carrier protein